MSQFKRFSAEIVILIGVIFASYNFFSLYECIGKNGCSYVVENPPLLVTLGIGLATLGILALKRLK